MDKKTLYALTRRLNNLRWKVNGFSKDGTKCMVVPYMDSRDVQERLDQVLGPENWQDSYEWTGGAVYCHLAIRINGEWVQKSDCGYVESTSKDKSTNKLVVKLDPKGMASDAFKRAAVKWGIGRYIYKIPMTWWQCDPQLKKPILNGEIIYDLDAVAMDLYVQDHKKAMTAIYKDLKDNAEDLSAYNSFAEAQYHIYEELGIDIDATPSDYWENKKAIIAIFGSAKKTAKAKRTKS